MKNVNIFTFSEKPEEIFNAAVEEYNRHEMNHIEDDSFVDKFAFSVANEKFAEFMDDKFDDIKYYSSDSSDSLVLQKCGIIPCVCMFPELNDNKISFNGASRFIFKLRDFGIDSGYISSFDLGKQIENGAMVLKNHYKDL